MALEEVNWDEYYQKIQGRAPRQLLLDALEKFPLGESRQAIDLGCGDGTETVVLLSRGWNVLAVDSELAGIKRLMDKVPQGAQPHLQTQVAKFEEVVLPPADLIHASYSIPFCHPDHFPAYGRRSQTPSSLADASPVNFLACMIHGRIVKA